MTSAPVFLGSDAVAKVFDWHEAVSAIQTAYGRPLPAAATPPRTVARDGPRWLRTLPAIPPGSRYFGAKLMGMNGAAATGGAEYVIVLFDGETSRIAAFVDGNLVTAYRTAATSAAAVDRLIGPAPVRLAVLGSGLEASMHTRALASIRTLTEVAVFSPTPASRTRFAGTLSAELNVPVRAAASAQEAVAGATLVLAAARSHGEQPILFADWLAADATVISIGSTVPEQREIDVSVIGRCDIIVCDMIEEVLHETGDMIAARDAGIDVAERSFALTELMSGALGARLSGSARRMFKSVGGGLQDVVIAEMVLTRALAQGLATPLPIDFQTKR
ncbi:MAG: ornithine cyclodeaminase family protein [Sphingomonas fennica]